MTKKQLLEYFHSMGMPTDYPLRGTKQQQADQGLAFFQLMVDYDCIQYYGITTTPEQDRNIAQTKQARNSVLATLESENMVLVTYPLH